MNSKRKMGGLLWGKRGWKMVVGALLLFGLCAGRGERDLGNNYIEGSDFQYMNLTNGTDCVTQADGEEEKFFLKGQYLYHLDEKTQTLLPLCNKADCLHDAETDADKLSMCNAYVEKMYPSLDMQISYYNGYIYYVAVLENKDITVAPSRQVLFRVKKDGSVKESVKEWQGWTIEKWIIHRGNFYYMEHTYVPEEEQSDDVASDIFRVKCFAFDGNKKEDVLYEAKREATILSVDKLIAYGDYLYFTVIGYDTLNQEQITEENYLNCFIYEHRWYCTKTGEKGKLTVPEMKRGVYINNMVLWDNKLVLRTYDFKQESNGKANIYCADLDGSNMQLILENVDEAYSLQSDGMYLYINNYFAVKKGETDNFQYFVYDKDMNLVDTFRPSYGEIKEFPVGSPDGAYFVISDDEEKVWKLCYFDKSVLGTLNGADMPYEVVAERGYSAKDLQAASGE